ncbi:MAG TPA: DUF2975 domain-containing protein [Allosphingosinicella sp.]|nr:DUF2975 domain-containing protein [Allosphingosinicella sp.]
MTRPYSAALPIAHVFLKLLIVLNWLVGAATIVLLIAMPNREWIISAFGLAAGPDADRVIMGMRAIAIIGLLMLPLYHLIFIRLLAMVGTVRAGDPFVIANASRLQQIAWAMIGLQLAGLVISIIVGAISTPAHPVNISAGLSTSGLLAILLAFVLARVFAEGARMRADLEGTV